MNGAFYVGATGLSAQQRALDLVAGNIANLNTPGYKRAQARFSELVSPAALASETAAPGAAPAPPGMLGVTVEAAPRDFTQGTLQVTGRAMDLAVSGEGFIELVGPGGQGVLWRGGTLQVNADGYLAAANGLPLKGMISVGPGAGPLTIGEDGKVSAAIDGSPAAASLGQIELVQVKDMSALVALDGGYYQAPEPRDVINATPGQDGAGLLKQGALEGSNVELTDAMVMLMLLQRAYSANAEVVQAGDQLMGIANSLRR